MEVIMTTSLQQVIHHAVTDAHFRAQLLADPRAAASSLGLTPSDEDLAVLMEMRHLLARQPATWLCSQRYSGPTRNWFGSRYFTHAVLAQGQ